MNAIQKIEPSNLAVVDPRASGDMQWWNMAKDQAAMLVKTGFLPESIKTPEQAVAIMMKGRELGIPAMYALSNIVIIKGKPTCNSELMLALIYRDHGDGALRIARSTNEVCAVAYRRSRWPSEQTYEFTVQDAQRAGLMGSDTWKKYTAAMLRARCISAVARMAFPDSIAGMYTPEELGATVDMNDDLETVGYEPASGLPPSASYGPGGIDRDTGEVLDAPIEPEMIAQDQLDRIALLRNQKGITDAGIKQLHGKRSAKDLTWDEAEALIEEIEAYPDVIDPVTQPAMIDVPDNDRHTR